MNAAYGCTAATHHPVGAGWTVPSAVLLHPLLLYTSCKVGESFCWRGHSPIASKLSSGSYAEAGIHGRSNSKVQDGNAQ